MCRSCMISYKKNKRETDSKYKEKDIIYNEKYKSSGRRKEVSDKRYNEKKEIIIKQCIEYNNKKYKTDPSFRIISIQRRRIAKIIQSTLKGTAYINSRIELIGCTPLELKEYILKSLEGQQVNPHTELLEDYAKQQGHPEYVIVDQSNIDQVVDNSETMNELLDNELEELRGELYSIYGSAYNNAYEEELYEDVWNELSTYFGKGEWISRPHTYKKDTSVEKYRAPI